MHPPIPQTDPRAGYHRNEGRDRRRDCPRAGRRAIHSRRRGRIVRTGVCGLARDRARGRRRQRHRRDRTGAAGLRHRPGRSGLYRLAYGGCDRRRDRAGWRRAGVGRYRAGRVYDRPRRARMGAGCGPAGSPGRGAAGASLRRARRYGADRSAGAAAGAARHRRLRAKPRRALSRPEHRRHRRYRRFQLLSDKEPRRAR